jgi:hypothetical protein
MRFKAAVVAVWVCAAPAHADDIGLHWPLRPGLPVVCRSFDAPAPDWQPGHRGVDLIGVPGQPVYAAGPGTVVFAGRLAGRGVDAAGGGLQQPVAAALGRAGPLQTAGIQPDRSARMHRSIGPQHSGMAGRVAGQTQRDGVGSRVGGSDRRPRFRWPSLCHFHDLCRSV